MFIQKFRKSCLDALNCYYINPALMCDRREGKGYYSIWKGIPKNNEKEEVLLEVVKIGNEISVYEWRENLKNCS